MEYRHELKFQMTRAGLEKIRYRLEPFLNYDVHQKGDFYTVRSLYFDDLYDSCLWENETGVERRTKYRLRIYNGSAGQINLEKKGKVHGMTKKEKEEIRQEECMDLLSEGRLQVRSGLTAELSCLMRLRGMKPVCLVEYDRCAMVSGVGNVRITFDTDVRGCGQPGLFLEKDKVPFLPVMRQGMHVLEVKYDELLPEYLLHAMDIGTLRRQSVSKYGLVRNGLAKIFN